MLTTTGKWVFQSMAPPGRVLRSPIQIISFREVNPGSCRDNNNKKKHKKEKPKIIER